MKELLSSSYFPKEWSYIVLELLDWIRGYNYLISRRNKQYPFALLDGKDYINIAAINGKSINPTNPTNLFLIVEITDKDGNRYVDTSGGKVINTTQYPTNNMSLFNKCFKIHPESVEAVSNNIANLISICNHWFDITGNEFILDPEYYWIE